MALPPPFYLKLDFSPSLLTSNVPNRNNAGTATNKRVAAAPKLVVSIKTNGYPEKLSLTGPINIIRVRSLYPTKARNAHKRVGNFVGATLQTATSS